ncbi:MAG: type IX secretion system sortase PorU [Prolixibacteraceae bacterium]|jgi:hypothetical protein|nr:type IX secretion system sortase PorU [Prolixibacteraceae bacterium]
MNKYLYLFLFILSGFFVNDIRKEVVMIDWYPSDTPQNGLGLSFTEAEYPDGIEGVPVYYRPVVIGDENYDALFAVENTLFEELDQEGGLTFNDNIPDEVILKKGEFRSGNNRIIQIQIPAVIRRDDKILLLKQFELKQIPVTMKSGSVATLNWKNESVLKGGKWFKVSTAGKGIYKIPYSRLTEWGFSNPENVSIYGAGGLSLTGKVGIVEFDDLPEISLWHGKNNGTDCIFFYDPGTTRWQTGSAESNFRHMLNPYTADGYFFLHEDAGHSKMIEPQDEVQGNPTHPVTSFDEYSLLEAEKFNLLRSGSKWFGDKFINGTTRNYTLPVLDQEDFREISLRINAAARSSASSEMVVSANQSVLGKINFARVNTSDVTSVYADMKESGFSISGEDSQVSLILKYFGSSANPEAWLDYIEINYRRKLKHYREDVLFFRDLTSVGEGNVLEFAIESTSPALKVWDVTDMFSIKEIALTSAGGKFVGKNSSSELKEYAAFDPDGNFPEPKAVGELENQNLHGIETPEFLIITHPEFFSYANELANYHRSYDGMKVGVVRSDKLYNEFSSGRKEATGIRNFIKMLYDRQEGLKYVLLFGDGSYDNKNINQGNKGFIPTFQSDNSLNPLASFVTDDYFVLLDEGETVYDGAMDLGIGRIPASSGQEAELVLNKIMTYNSPEALGNWRNRVCFIADDEDDNLHMYDSERLAGLVNGNHGEFITDKIYFDAYKQITGPGGESYPDVTRAINDRVKEGVLILNYVGHANDRFIADENVLDISHINSWSNSKRLPVFVTATCEFSRFDNDETSAGEYVLLNRNGGGIGLFSTSRLAFAVSNYFISRSFYSYVFQKDTDGNPYRMGDIMKLAKVNTINSINKRNFVLLADPALRLSYPQYRVITTEINGQPAAGQPDTLGALQQVTVSGHIEDGKGRMMNDFTGEIMPSVYDKAAMIKTLGNAGQTPFEFKVQENIIYKGVANVIDGKFTFSFVIPKDISYSTGEGKILYYAENGQTDAHGVFDNFYIGGQGSDVVDNQGPEIELFIDSRDFVSGDKVNKNCTLLAFLSDNNGINTAGTGIGHDITAILNNDPSAIMVLNDYYMADMSNHTGGTISFPLRDLPAGRHSLKVKAWDVANNSAESEIEFEVIDNFQIFNIVNYPNPVTDHTFISFEHNEPDATFNAIFEIFDISGRRLDYFKTIVGSGGNISNPVRWDTGSSGKGFRSGVYTYIITVKNRDGAVTSGSGKMIISH